MSFLNISHCSHVQVIITICSVNNFRSLAIVDFLLEPSAGREASRIFMSSPVKVN